MIEFESVSKTFRDGTAAVVDLSLTVPSGKITVFVGPSGCGKTTTLRMVNRMIEPTKGRILWDGNPLRSKRKTTLRRQMGYVIQNGGLFPHRTVVENVGTVPGLLGWDKNKTQNRAMELLDAVGLDSKLAHRYPAQLSGGQQQRVGVARALAADPLVMLMDEPFSAVDPVVRSELHELFLGLQRQLSKTIILITHDIDEAIKLGDQVAILRVGGVLAQVGTPQQLLDEPADAFVEGFVGRDRGFRALSFLPASSLSLTRVKAVRDPASVTAPEPTLVVDADAKPLGWADGRRPGQVYGLGSTFDPEQDTLRAALDAALTSPVGVAVAVSAESGRYAGVVSAAEILSQATSSRATVAESVAVRGQGAIADTQTDEPADETGAGAGEGGSHAIIDGASGEGPAAEDNAPAAEDNAPAAGGGDLVAERDAPAAEDNAPAAEDNAPAAEGGDLVAERDAPAAEDSAPAPQPAETRPEPPHSQHPSVEGRASAEPGLASDELDGARSSSHPAKRSP